MMLGRTAKTGGIVLLVGALGLVVWRGTPMVGDAAIGAYLSGKAIESSYRIEALSPTRIVITNLRLGPADRPELTVTRLTAQMTGSPFRPTVTALRLEQPRLRLAVGADGMSLGSLDRLLPPPKAEPEPFPPIDMQIVDGLAQAATPVGPVVVQMQGHGRLSDGFRADLTMAPHSLRHAGCRADDMAARAQLSIHRIRLTILAEGTAAQAGCGTAALRTARLQGEVVSDTSLRRMHGTLRLAADRLTDGETGAMQPVLTAAFEGETAKLGGRWTLAADKTHWPSGQLQRVTGQGRFQGQAGAATFDVSGQMAAQGVAVDLMPLLKAPLAAVHRTPVEAPAGLLATRMAHAARHVALNVPFAAQFKRGDMRLDVPGWTAQAANGARLAFGQGAGLRLTTRGATIDGRVTVQGGALPSTSLQLTQVGLGTARTGDVALQIAPWRAGATTLAVPDLRVEMQPATFATRGVVHYAGPVGAGARMEGLKLGFDLRGQAMLGATRISGNCVTVAFKALDRADLHLGPAQSALCPEGPLLVQAGGVRGGVKIMPVRLAGWSRAERQRLDGHSGALRVQFKDRAWTVLPASVTAALGGMAGRGTIGGRGAWTHGGMEARGSLRDFAISGPDLPVQIDQGRAAWRYTRRGVQWADGALRVRDRQAPWRFQPLQIAALQGEVAGSALKASGHARLAAQTGAAVRLFSFTARHDLKTGVGRADAATGALEFGDRLQPYEITEALRGVIENVRGPVEGTATLRWTADRFDSRGQLALNDVNLATAALGPVTGIKGTVAFDDLVGMVSAPDQTLSVASINPGVLVENGQFRFQMLAPARVRIAAALWPFEGGTLELEPVLLDEAQTERHFTLRVTGLDAAHFLQRFDLKNLSATGSFDGVLPLVFADGKGRIVGGELTARSPGGLLQYVGQVGAESMGASGKMAFDALKRLRYRSMILTFDGDLDGELVTSIRFAGQNENPVQPGTGMALPTTGLPFKFNVTVRAPFRRLLGTAASFGDAREMIKSTISATPPAAPVQPK